MATAGPADRSTLNNVTPNLQVGQFADPSLRLAVFQYLFDLSDANWNNVDNRISDRYTKAQVDAAILQAQFGQPPLNSITWGYLASDVRDGLIYGVIW